MVLRIILLIGIFLIPINLMSFEWDLETKKDFITKSNNCFQKSGSAQMSWCMPILAESEYEAIAEMLRLKRKLSETISTRWVWKTTTSGFKYAIKEAFASITLNELKKDRVCEPFKDGVYCEFYFTQLNYEKYHYKNGKRIYVKEN